MLHIIFLILKILGWILLGILALVLVLFGILLLNPVKYKLNGSCKGTLDSLSASATARWLFHLIAVEAEYKDEELNWKFRIAWKKFSSAEEENSASATESSISKSPQADLPDRSVSSVFSDQPDKEHTSVQQQPPSSSSEIKSSSKEAKTVSEETGKTAETKCEKRAVEDPIKQKKEDSGSSGQTPQSVSPGTHRQTTSKKEKGQEERDLFERFYEKLTAPFQKLIQKIKYTFQKICDKVKILIKKKERLQAFLTYEIHQSAFAKTVKELKRLLRFLKPKRISASIEFGFSDPSWTGYALAFLGMIYPFLGEYTEFRPDFEKKVLKGKGVVEGKIRLVYFLIPALHLLLDKKIRITYRHIRKFKL